MTREHRKSRLTRQGGRLVAYGAWLTALFFGVSAQAHAEVREREEISLQRLLDADEASVSSLVRGAMNQDKLIPRVLPKTPKWQGQLADLQDVPNEAGIQVRVAVPAHSRVTLGNSAVNFEQPANVVVGMKDKAPSAPSACQGSCEGLSLKALEQDVVAAIPPGSAGAARDDGQALTLHLAPDHVELTPNRVRLAKVGEHWQVRMSGTAFDHGAGVSIFVRDSRIIRWKSATRVIEAAAVGHTELYVVAGGEMKIIPVDVEQGGNDVKAPSLSVAGSLLSLNKVLKSSSGSQAARVQVASLDSDLPSYYDHAAAAADAATLMDDDAVVETNRDDAMADGNRDDVMTDDASMENAAVAATSTEVADAGAPDVTTATSHQDDLGVADDIQVYAYRGERKIQAKLGKLNPLSLRDSAIEAIKTQELAKRQDSSFVRERKHSEYKTISFQVIDERSIPERGIIYPVVGAQVRILGTEFVATTNATGHVIVSDIPADAHILVAVDDKRGQVRPTTTEVVVKALAANEVTRVKVLSYKTYDAYANIFGAVPVAEQGSYCGRLLPSADRPSVANLNVRIRGGAEGPYYFSTFGPSPNQVVTGEDGRFCFLNVDPGLFEVGVYEGDEYLASLVVPIFSGRHSEDELSLGGGPEVRTRIAAQANAHNQIFGDRFAAGKMEAVDAIDMTVIGENEQMGYVDSGLLNVAEGATFHKGRKYVMANAAEFEPVLYGIDADEAERPTVTPLLPRGFVEEVYEELSAGGSGNGDGYDPSLGSLVVNHGALEGQGHKAINIKLVDPQGQEVEGGWYYGAEGADVTKAIFFNLQPGLYTVVVESENNYWLAVDTVAVDNAATSYVATGSRLGYRAPQDLATY